MENKLLKLIDKAETLIEEGIKDSSLKPEEELFFRWELKDFKYGTKGIESSSADGINFVKNTWFRASRQVAGLVKNIDKYDAALKDLKEKFSGKEGIERSLEMFVGRVVWKLFLERERDRPGFNKGAFVARFISDLEGKPANYGAKIQFQGIVLEPAQIKVPEVSILLRQPTREDLEKEMPYYGPSFSHQLAYPSAIGEIDFLGHHGREIQVRVEKLTVLLRLFKVGSVKHLSYSMHTDSLVDIGAGGTMTSGGHLVAIESSIIQTSDEEKLKNFIQVLDPLLPTKLYMFGEGMVTPVTIAFDRYNDALLRVSILEERIANATAGLEALLTDRQRQGSYVLRTLVAKVMSFLGEDPEQTRTLVEDAYRIRNLFTHGGHLSNRKLKDFENTYGEVKNILLEILDCLRCVIVISIISKKDKDTLVKLIEDSLFKKEAEDELNEVLATAKKVL